MCCVSQKTHGPNPPTQVWKRNDFQSWSQFKCRLGENYEPQGKPKIAVSSIMDWFFINVVIKNTPRNNERKVLTKGGRVLDYRCLYTNITSETVLWAPITPSPVYG